MIPASDAFVFFGATGDLAYKKIFPALQALIRRGDAGHARSSASRARAGRRAAARTRARQPRAQWRRRCRRVRQAVGATAVHRRRLQRSGHLRAPAAGAGRCSSDRCTTSRFRRACSPPWCRGWRRPAARDDARVVVEKPFGRDLASAQALNRTPARGVPRDSRSSASTITWARRRCRTCCISASPTPSSSRSGTATTSTTCRSPWPRISACRAAAAFYEEVGAIRDVVQNHLLQVVALLAMDAPIGDDAGAIHAEKLRLFRAMRPLDPDQVVRGQFRGYRDEAGVARGFAASKPSPRCACTSTPGAGPACRSTSAPASACR